MDEIFLKTPSLEEEAILIVTIASCKTMTT
jgi:hypothetical protein